MEKYTDDEIDMDLNVYDHHNILDLIDQSDQSIRNMSINP